MLPSTTRRFKNTAGASHRCKFNKLNLNWSNAHFKFISKKRVKIKVDDNLAKTVDHFKLLGVTLR